MRNLNRVPTKQWLKWSIAARGVFNKTYVFLMRHPELITHPKQVKLPAVQWKTIAWNAAWIAADAADGYALELLLAEAQAIESRKVA